jgi:hypothetical protein
LAKVAVQCSADKFVVNQTLVLRINICGENRHLRQARKRYLQGYDDRAKNKKMTERKNNYICQIMSRLNYVNNLWR